MQQSIEDNHCTKSDREKKINAEFKVLLLFSLLPDEIFMQCVSCRPTHERLLLRVVEVEKEKNGI